VSQVGSLRARAGLSRRAARAHLDRQRAARDAQGRGRARAGAVHRHVRRPDRPGRGLGAARLSRSGARRRRGAAPGAALMGQLRTLGATQQVALLFVVLFGVLALASIVVFGRSFRERDAAAAASHERLMRDVRAVWGGGAVFWIAWASGAFVSTLLFGVLSFVALREFVTLTHTRRGDHRSLILAFFVVLPAQYLLVGLRYFNAFTVFIPVYVFLAIPVISAFGNDP